MNVPIYTNIELFGEPLPGGVYVLSILLSRAQRLAFGKFNRGKPLLLLPGSYLYVGSARGEKGAATLGYRLVRHATRTRNTPPHKIRPALVSSLRAAGLAVKIPRQKKLHWHIDYLLDLSAAETQGVIAIRTREDLEPVIARNLAQAAETRGIAPGLGASDHLHATHLLYVEANQDWWDFLPETVLGMT